MSFRFPSYRNLCRYLGETDALVELTELALKRHNPALPPEAITAAGLNEWLADACRKSLISSRFLFEWKTSL